MRLSFARTAVVGVAVAALAAGGTAVALADTTTPAPPATPAPAAKHHGHDLLRRALHGEVVLHAKTGDRTVDAQRGVVTAANTTSVTVRSTDGFSQTYTFTPTSKVRRQKAASSPSAVAVNDRVVVVAQRTPQGLDVTRLADAGPAPAPSTPAAPTPTS